MSSATVCGPGTVFTGASFTAVTVIATVSTSVALFVSVVVAVFAGGLTYLRISKVLGLEELASVRRLWSRKRRRSGPVEAADEGPGAG